MTLKELTENRYSVRTYTTQEVEKQKIDYILECARLAPSACNNQPWHFYVISSEEAKMQIQKSYDREWFKSAPLYIIACGNHSESWKRSSIDNIDYCYVDIAIAAEHICLSAVEMNLGTCWVCNFNPEIISTFLNLSADIEPIAIFPIGYIAENSVIPNKKRKAANDIVTWI